jgi:hypothetical protein
MYYTQKMQLNSVSCSYKPFLEVELGALQLQIHSADTLYVMVGCLQLQVLQQQRLRDRLPAGSILTSGFNLPYFTGHFFCFWSFLDQFGLILVNFCGRFFLFSLFLHFQIRYTRTPEGRLMISSSQTQFKAGQLGSKGCWIWAVCPPCGFGLKPLACFTQIVFEHGYSPEVLVLAGISKRGDQEHE